MLMVEFFILFVILGLIGMAIGVWKVRELKAEFEAKNQLGIQEILASLDKMECLDDVRQHAAGLAEVMKRRGVRGVIAPLNSGARVSLQLQGDALSIVPV